MVTKEYFYRIRIKVVDIKKVIEAYNALDRKGYIEFRPAGIFSGQVDVIHENFNLIRKLGENGCFVKLKNVVEFICTNPNEVENHDALNDFRVPKVVNIQFTDQSDNKRERIVTVDGEEYFRDKNTMKAYGELNDPLRKLELWLYDMELRHVNH